MTSTNSFLLLILLWGMFCSNCMAVSFPDYFPLDPTIHGIKTFEWTYGHTGSYQSYISGTHTVPYVSGEVESIGVANYWGGSHLYATNDGNVVQWIGGTEFEVPNLVYFSTDCELNAPPASWTFSTISDDELFYQGLTAFIDSNDFSCTVDDNMQSLLFDIQNVTVPFSQYNNAIIIWCIDHQYDYVPVDFKGKDVELGITFPNSVQTDGHSVTDFDIYALGVGMIAHGGIDAEPGILKDIAVLVSVRDCIYSIAGDLNQDCKVDLEDFAMMARNWLLDCELTPDDPDCIPFQ